LAGPQRDMKVERAGMGRQAQGGRAGGHGLTEPAGFGPPGARR
jgi:hypothetical protein